MPINLRGQSLLTTEQFTRDEFQYLLDKSIDLKAKKRAGIKNDLLKGKNIVLLFEKDSTRTRCAFEVACFDEGANVTYLTGSQMGKKETMEDTAKVLGRFYDGIEFRGFAQETVETLAKYSGVPVWNGLTDHDHPTQVLADFMTIMENTTKPLHQCKLVYCGDGRNNVANALMMGAAIMGMNYVTLTPKELSPEPKFFERMQKLAKESGAKLEVYDISKKAEALKGADALYTDVWVSMGEEAKMAERVKLLTDYRVTMEFIKLTGNPDVIYLHCLPAFHDFLTTVAKEAQKNGLDCREVEDDVFRSKHSKVFDEAENRMHTIKAIMVSTLVG